MFIDSHAHLHHLILKSYDGQLSSAIQASKDAGVDHILCVCITPEEREALLEIVDTYPDITASVGLHPNEEIEKEPTEEDLVAWADHPKIVAIGETGLDYYRTDEGTEWQKNRFRNHIRAANRLKKPLIIHTRMAREDTLSVLREENAQNVGGVFHCFTETWEMAKAGLDLGFYISFSGIITFKNAEEIREVVKKVPLERILIETDAPYLAPVPYRGKPNEPAYVRYVAEMVAELKNLSVKEVAEQTSENFYRLFSGAR